MASGIGPSDRICSRSPAPQTRHVVRWTISGHCGLSGHAIDSHERRMPSASSVGGRPGRQVAKPRDVRPRRATSRPRDRQSAEVQERPVDAQDRGGGFGETHGRTSDGRCQVHDFTRAGAAHPSRSNPSATSSTYVKSRRCRPAVRASRVTRPSGPHERGQQSTIGARRVRRR